MWPTYLSYIQLSAKVCMPLGQNEEICRLHISLSNKQTKKIWKKETANFFFEIAIEICHEARTSKKFAII